MLGIYHVQLVGVLAIPESTMCVHPRVDIHTSRMGLIVYAVGPGQAVDIAVAYANHHEDAGYEWSLWAQPVEIQGVLSVNCAGIPKPIRRSTTYRLDRDWARTKGD